jgi:hypothetical protein
MPPKRCCSVAPDLKEEDGQNMFNVLDKMRAYKESAFDESWTGTYPLFCIWFVDRLCDFSLF